MTMAHRSGPKRGTWLVLGFLVFASILVVISRVYRTPPPEDWQVIAQQEGIPAARRGMNLSREGRKLLPVEEQRELDALYAEALQALTPDEKQQFLMLAQKGSAASDQEIAESVELMQKALRALPQEKSARLWTLVEKAVQLQLAEKTPPTAAEPQE